MDKRKPKEYKGYTIEPCEMFLNFRTVQAWKFTDVHGNVQKSTRQRVIKAMIEKQAGERREIREPIPGIRAVYEKHDGPETRYLTESERLTLRQCTGKTRSIMVDPVKAI